VEEDLKLAEVPLEKLVLNPYGLRVRYDRENVEQLAGSIIQNGLAEPLSVIERNGSYLIIDGNYRCLALMHAKWEKPVPVVVEDLTDEQALMRAVIANWHRRNFNFMDKARSVAQLKQKGYSVEAITMQLEFKNPKYFYRFLEFETDVSKEAKAVLESYSRVTWRHSQALVMLKDYPDKQLELAQRIVTEHLTGPEAVREADKILNPEKYVREAKPWICDCCEQEQSPEEGKAIIKLCPKCLGDFEAWRHESGRVAEST
jgi:ParB family chromosome partitioning protein